MFAPVVHAIIKGRMVDTYSNKDEIFLIRLCLFASPPACLLRLSRKYCWALQISKTRCFCGIIRIHICVGSDISYRFLVGIRPIDYEIPWSYCNCMYILIYISCINLCVVSKAYLFSLLSFLIIVLIFACSFAQALHRFLLPPCLQVAFLGHTVR
jgi:hypothetical protein